MENALSHDFGNERHLPEFYDFFTFNFILILHLEGVLRFLIPSRHPLKSIRSMGVHKLFIDGIVDLKVAKRCGINIGHC